MELGKAAQALSKWCAVWLMLPPPQYFSHFHLMERSLGPLHMWRRTTQASPHLRVELGHWRGEVPEHPWPETATRLLLEHQLPQPWSTHSPLSKMT